MAAVTSCTDDPALNGLAAAAAADAKLQPASAQRKVSFVQTVVAANQLCVFEFCQTNKVEASQSAGVAIRVQGHDCIARGCTLPVGVARACRLPNGLPQGHLRA